MFLSEIRDAKERLSYNNTLNNHEEIVLPDTLKKPTSSWLIKSTDKAINKL